MNQWGRCHHICQACFIMLVAEVTIGSHSIVPDHKLKVSIVSRVVRVGSSEQVVGDISAQVVSGIIPYGAGGHAVDAADQLLCSYISLHVWKRLDVGGTASPSPVSVPRRGISDPVVCDTAESSRRCS